MQPSTHGIGNLPIENFISLYYFATLQGCYFQYVFLFLNPVLNAYYRNRKYAFQVLRAICSFFTLVQVHFRSFH